MTQIPPITMATRFRGFLPVVIDVVELIDFEFGVLVEPK